MQFNEMQSITFCSQEIEKLFVAPALIETLIVKTFAVFKAGKSVFLQSQYKSDN